MGRTQYYTATSVDGFIADPDNSLTWLFESDRGGEGSQRFPAFFAGVGAMCMGATTYEWVLDHDNLLEQPERWKDYYGDTPSWVFTHRDLPAVPGCDIRFVSGDVVPVHREMAAVAGERNVWIVGGGELVGAFDDAGLLDEIMVSLAPVFLGAGAPLLPRRILASRLNLTAVERQVQFVHLTYEVTRP